MHSKVRAILRAGIAASIVSLAFAPAARAQHEGHDEEQAPAAAPAAEHAPAEAHRMLGVPVGGGWSLVGMGQVFPTLTIGAPGEEGTHLRETEVYATQPAVMLNLESPGSRFTLRTTLNFEAWTQAGGELTFGGWGEGFIDKRHPHTLLHEAMVSVNLWDVAGGAASLSAGKGFAPFGTDDPMARPVLKYPTNHHLSQILERWTVNGVYLRGGWSVEAGVFGGAEPEGPYDLSNIESFGDSWSIRTAQRFGGTGPFAEWEISASYAEVSESHGTESVTTKLANVAFRHDHRHEFGRVYGLVEFSRSQDEHDESYFSLVGEGALEMGPHQPYGRIEFASRPEFPREGPGEGLFRYDHHDHAIGATRWLIPTLGYGYEMTGFPVSARPYVEAQYHRVWEERGGIDPVALLGTDRFWSLSFGVRLFFGGDPMRMGSYGVLDPMTVMTRAMDRPAEPHHAHEEEG